MLNLDAQTYTGSSALTWLLCRLVGNSKPIVRIPHWLHERKQLQNQIWVRVAVCTRHVVSFT